MLGNYFGFFHGVLTDLWISLGFWEKGKWVEGSGAFAGLLDCHRALHSVEPPPVRFDLIGKVFLNIGDFVGIHQAKVLEMS
jgi:hypothetical protein